MFILPTTKALLFSIPGTEKPSAAITPDGTMCISRSLGRYGSRTSRMVEDDPLSTVMYVAAPVV